MAELDEEAIFNAARKFDRPDEREAYLRRACGDDRTAYDRVATLLRAYESEPAFLESPPAELGPRTDVASVTEGPGTVIGRYKLLELIGEGGFAVVYMAEQNQPIRRQVALKVIKLGMDTHQVIARFEAERQALAMMDHPGIAEVYDAGATETGRPYFVMQLIRGIPITEYCDHNCLATEARLRLFLDVCHAVQHAHQKGIIHRDIKPTNVLVALHDGRPVPKVIDFGIAKATHQRLTEKTLYTSYRQIIGTPQYMSPEQAEFSDLDIDTRSDIYSLGVLLYELLTSTTPFQPGDLQQIGYDEICHMIRHSEPPTPSRRLSTLGDAAAEAAKNRQIDSAGLRKLLHGDLDWIVMKALEKDRARRYETADALALDIERHLTHEPVQARPPSTAYQVQKFVRKHRGPVFAAAAIFATLIIALVLAVVALVRIYHERQVANAERRRADANFERSREVVDRVLARAAKELQYIPYTDDIRRTVLADSREFYEGFLDQYGDDPKARFDAALAYRQLGQISVELREAELAATYATKAVTLLAELAREFPDNEKYRDELLLSQQLVPSPFGMFEAPDEDAQRDEAEVRLAEELTRQYPMIPYYLDRLAQAYADVGNSHSRAGRREEAEQLLRRSLTLREERAAKFPDLPLDRNGLAHSHHWLAAAVVDVNERGRHLQKALELYREQKNKLPDDSFAIRGYAHVLEYLAKWNHGQGNLKIAEAQCREAIDVLEQWLRESTHGQNERRLSDRQRITEFHRRLGWTFWSLANILAAQEGREVELDDAHKRRIEQAEVVAAEAENTAFRNELSRSYATYAEFLCQRSDIEQRDFDLALEFAHRATKIDPTNRDAWATLTEVRRARGETDQTDAVGREVPRRSPNAQ